MAELCLFCNQFEKGHSQSVNYICSNCVQWLLNFSQAALKQYHRSMLTAGLKSKANAIESFVKIKNV